MPDNYLVTGSRGGSSPHVSSSQARNFHAGIVGDGKYVMSGLTASVTSANTVHIGPGVACFNGADVEVPAGGVDLTIENGSQGMKRNDLIVFRYENGSVESAQLVVITGTPAASEPSDPSYNDGSILDGDSPCDMPLYRITLDGISVGDPEAVFESASSIGALRDSVSQGYVTTSGLYGGSTTDVEVSFPRAYAEPPTVVAGLASVSSAPDLGSISVAVAKVTETGCTLRFYNNSSSSRAPAANWVAVGRA